MLKFFCFFMLMILNLPAVAQTPFKGLSNSNIYACAHTDSKISCWGVNFYKQVQTIEGLSKIKSLETSLKYACAADELGLICWGQAPDFPLEFSSDSDISMIKLGSKTICVLSSGKISCSNTSHGLSPSQSNRISSFDMNDDLICAIQEGQLLCWGETSDAKILISKIPLDLGNIVRVDLGKNKACVLTTENRIKCWVSDDMGSPILNIPDQTGVVKDFQLGDDHACLLNAEHLIKCWGYFIDPTPEDYYADVGATSITTSPTNNCLVDQKGTIKCWGVDHYSLTPPPYVKPHPLFMSGGTRNTFFGYQDEIIYAGADLINFDFTVKNLRYMTSGVYTVCLIDEEGPRCIDPFGNDYRNLISRVQGITEFSVAYAFVCILDTKGEVTCQKDGIIFEPKNVHHVIKISSGGSYHCALMESGGMECWDKKSILTIPHASKEITDFATGGEHLCTLTSDDSIDCRNLFGSTNYLQDAPTHLIGIRGLIAGLDFACAYTDTDISCWGGYHGSMSLSPPKPQGKIKKVMASNLHACFEDEVSIKCWGNDQYMPYLFLQN